MSIVGLPSLEKLKKDFQSLPGVGPKSALRMALHILQITDEAAENFVSSIQTARRQLGFCNQCNGFTEKSQVCKICNDPDRDRKIICVVEDPFVVLTLEQRHKAHWVYHVTHGLISPLEKIYPDNLQLNNLFNRLQDTQEIILAFSSSVEGEATASHLKEEIKRLNPNIKLSRIAHGIPFGARLDTVDAMTLEQALQFRQPMI